MKWSHWFYIIHVGLQQAVLQETIQKLLLLFSVENMKFEKGNLLNRGKEVPNCCHELFVHTSPTRLRCQCLGLFDRLSCLGLHLCIKMLKYTIVHRAGKYQNMPLYIFTSKDQNMSLYIIASKYQNMSLFIFA